MPFPSKSRQFRSSFQERLIFDFTNWSADNLWERGFRNLELLYFSKCETSTQAHLATVAWGWRVTFSTTLTQAGSAGWRTGAPGTPSTPVSVYGTERLKTHPSLGVIADTIRTTVSWCWWVTQSLTKVKKRTLLFDLLFASSLVFVRTWFDQRTCF